MVKTIGNPFSWTVQRLAGAGEHVGETLETLGGTETELPVVRSLTEDDLRHALRRGFEDFAAARADVMFICLVYPVIGVVLAAFGLHASLLPLLFPVAAGFVLLGPLAAVGLYEVSRRRERGEDVNWLSALAVIRAPNFGAVVVLGLYLFGLFLAWLMTAAYIYSVTLGPAPPESVAAFLRDVFTTGAGWVMIVVGMGVGFVFALAVLAMSVVSFPLLLDRRVGVPVAIRTSFEVYRRNPRVISLWGLIVAVSLALGSIPAFVGLIVVMPILGHATWHLYRRAVRPA